METTMMMRRRHGDRLQMEAGEIGRKVERVWTL